jgi:hypothetical protein
MKSQLITSDTGDGGGNKGREPDAGSHGEGDGMAVERPGQGWLSNVQEARLFRAHREFVVTNVGPLSSAGASLIAA